MNASFLTIDRGKKPVVKSDDLESGHTEIISTVLKNKSYLLNFDVFDGDL